MSDNGRDDAHAPRPVASAGARTLAPLLAANVLFACGLFVHGFLFNFYLQGLGATTEVMGYQAAALTVGGMIALVPTGWVVDRTGAREALVGAAMCTGLALALGALASSPMVLYLAAVAAGAGTSCWRVATAPVLMQLDDRLRARALSLNVALLVASGGAWTAGSGALSVWGRDALGLSMQSSYRFALLAGAAGTLASGVVFFLAVPRSPHNLRHADRNVAVARGEGRRLLDGIPSWVILAVPLLALWMTGSALVQPFLNIYFQRSYGLTVDRVGFILAAAQWTAALCVAVSGEAAHRLGSPRVLLAWLLALPPVLWLLASAGTLPGAIALSLAFGAIAPATFPLIDQALLQRVSPSRYGITSGLRNAATEGSGALGASVGGVLLRSTGFSALFWLAGAVSAVAATALAAMLVRRRAAPNAGRLASAE